MMSRLMTRREQLILGGFGAAVLLGAITLTAIYRATPPPPVEIGGAPVVDAPALESAPPAAVAPDAPKPARPHPATPVPAEPAATPAALPQPALPQPTAVAIPEQVNIGVSIAGSVEKPGFYWLPPDSRVQELLDAAGGVVDGADLSDINLGAKLIDSTTLIVPRAAMQSNVDGVLRARGRDAVVNPPQYTISLAHLVEEDTAPAAAVPQAYGVSTPAQAQPLVSAPTGKTDLIDLNTASQQDLESLPGIGPAFAERIIAGRPYSSVADLDRVSGIGPKRLASLKGLVTVGQ